MKLCLAILFACLVGAYCGNAGVAANAKAGDAQRVWARRQGANQDWANTDQKSGQVNQDWDQQANSASSDKNSAQQNWGKASSSWNTNRDAANRAGNKAAANNAARDGKAAWSASNNYDKNQNWARNGGWKNANRRTERIGYAFDKSYNRNANDNGGFDAGSSLADRAVDDQGEKSSSYDRRQSDHAARAANADAQSADRSAGFGNGAWRQAGASDRNNRGWRQSAGANANSRDWAEKRDTSQNTNTLSAQQRSRAADALVDRANVDRDANRASQAHGRALGVRRPYGGKGYAYGRPAGYGYAGVGNGYGRNGAAADASRVSDSANRNRQQNWAGNNWQDRTKDAASRDQWQSDSVQGFNRDRAATLWDQGAAANAAQRGQGAQAADRQWADAKAAKAANQARHDFDETDWKNANQKWNRADRDHKKKEWKKFFSNDKTGGENTERLWYDRAQKDDNAAADFGNQRDNSARWQDAQNYDSRAQRARGADWAAANEARNRYWDQDSSRDANARDQQRAASADAANRGRWGADNDNRDYKVDQERSDAASRYEQNNDRDAQRRGYGAFRGRGALNGGLGYGAGYNAGYGNAGYGAGYGGKGGYGAGYGNGYGANGYYGYGAPFNNKYGGRFY